MTDSIPAPWRVEQYRSQVGKTLFELVASNGKPVIVSDNRKELESIAKSRNEATAAQDLREMQSMYKSAIREMDERMESMRAHKDREYAKLAESYHQISAELDDLKKERG